MYLLYSLLFSAGVLVTAPYYLWRHRGELGSGAWRERLGFLPLDGRSFQAGGIWVHAVSVGETLSAVPLVQALSGAYPARPIVISHVTPAGRKVGEQRLPNVAARFYLPLDWAWSVRRALKIIRPAVLLIMETEIWPNLLQAAQQTQCRVAIVNARISDRSFRRYRRVRPFMRRVLQSVDHFYAQSEADAERLRQIGVPAEKVTVTGNLKYDIAPPSPNSWVAETKQRLADMRRAPVWLAASTMPGEERLLLPVARAVRERFPRALWMVAPRHPSRFDEVEQLLKDSGLRTVRRTRLDGMSEESRSALESAEALLLDTMGELAASFDLADVVFMGGTLAPTGGHNLIEPALAGKAILIGPHMENFRDVATHFLGAGAVLQVPDGAAVAPTLLHLLGDASARDQLGARARQVLNEQRGATARTLGQIKTWLEMPTS